MTGWLDSHLVEQHCYKNHEAIHLAETPVVTYLAWYIISIINCCFSLYIVYNEIEDLSMGSREYNLGKRAEQMEQTRQRILAAGRDLFTQEGFHQVSVAEIATRASVTRATVYNYFDSKSGLLIAVLEELERRAGIDRLADAMHLPDPVEALRTFLRDHCRFWASDVLVFRNVFNLSAFDPALNEAVTQKNRDRKASITKLVKRIAGDERLHPTVTQAQAVETVWLLTHFETFDFLYRTGQLDVKEVAEILVTLSESLVVD